MSDELRKLMGGYATGSLSETERKQLFEAALEDQELFDELAREDALREVLAAPGAKQRVLAALEKPQRTPAAWWTRPWSWAVAGIVSALGVIGILEVRSNESVKQVEVADSRVQLDRSPEVAPEQPKPELAPVPPLARRRAAAVRETEPASPAAKDASPAPPPAPEAAPPPPPPQESFRAARPEPPPAVALADKTEKKAENQVAAAGSIAGTVRAPKAMTPAAMMATRASLRFAFDYSLDASGLLTVTPAADGYLTVETVNGATTQPIAGIGENGRISARVPVSVRVPANADAVNIRFARTQGRTSDALTRRDAESGTVEDPNPSANSSLNIQIRRR